MTLTIAGIEWTFGERLTVEGADVLCFSVDSDGNTTGDLVSQVLDAAGLSTSQLELEDGSAFIKATKDWQF